MSLNRVYFCGSFYTPEEQKKLEYLTNLIPSNFIFDLPHKGSLEFFYFHLLNSFILEHESEDSILYQNYIYYSQLYNIFKYSNILIYNMNGRVPDMGALLQTSLFYSSGRPIIIYKNDHRSKIFGMDNSMITGLTPEFKTINEINKIPKEIKKLSQTINNTKSMIPKQLTGYITKGEIFCKLKENVKTDLVNLKNTHEIYINIMREIEREKQ